MSTLRVTALAVAKLALVLFTVVASLGVALTALSPSVACCEPQLDEGGRGPPPVPRHGRTAPRPGRPRRAGAHVQQTRRRKATGGTTAAAGPPSSKCATSRARPLPTVSFRSSRHLERLVRHELLVDAVPSPGSCGPQHSFTAGRRCSRGGGVPGRSRRQYHRGLPRDQRHTGRPSVGLAFAPHGQHRPHRPGRHHHVRPPPQADAGAVQVAGRPVCPGLLQLLRHRDRLQLDAERQDQPVQ